MPPKWDPPHFAAREGCVFAIDASYAMGNSQFDTVIKACVGIVARRMLGGYKTTPVGAVCFNGEQDSDDASGSTLLLEPEHPSERVMERLKDIEAGGEPGKYADALQTGLDALLRTAKGQSLREIILFVHPQSLYRVEKRVILALAHNFSRNNGVLSVVMCGDDNEADEGHYLRLRALVTDIGNGSRIYMLDEFLPKVYGPAPTLPGVRQSQVNIAIGSKCTLSGRIASYISRKAPMSGKSVRKPKNPQDMDNLHFVTPNSRREYYQERNGGASTSQTELAAPPSDAPLTPVYYYAGKMIMLDAFDIPNDPEPPVSQIDFLFTVNESAILPQWRMNDVYLITSSPGFMKEQLMFSGFVNALRLRKLVAIVRYRMKTVSSRSADDESPPPGRILLGCLMPTGTDQDFEGFYFLQLPFKDDIKTFFYKSLSYKTRDEQDEVAQSRLESAMDDLVDDMDLTRLTNEWDEPWFDPHESPSIPVNGIANIAFLSLMSKQFPDEPHFHDLSTYEPLRKYAVNPLSSVAAESLDTIRGLNLVRDRPTKRARTKGHALVAEGDEGNDFDLLEGNARYEEPETDDEL